MRKLSFSFLTAGFLILFLWPLKVHGAQPVSADSVKLQKPAIKDYWIAPDKGLHFLGSMMATIASAKTLEQQFDFNKERSRAWAIGFSISLGVAKELRDSRQPNNFFSWKDLTADCLGTALGRLILELK
ncbi:YfiM family protein [Calditrichota bacterium LG25]